MGNAFGGPSKLTDEEKIRRWSEMYEGYRRSKFEAVKEMTAAELQRKRKDPGTAASLLIIDCREDAERQISTIPGAITKKEFEKIHQMQWNPRTTKQMVMKHQ